MNIQITDRREEGVGRTIKISVPADLVSTAQDKAARSYASKVRIPGFRPGKAPPAVVRKRFADQIRSETLDNLINSAFREVVERESLEVVGQPHVHDLAYQEGAELTFALHFEVRPSINLEKLTDFQLERPSVAVQESDILEQLDHLRDEKGVFAPLLGRPALGDVVKVELAVAGEDGQLSEGNQYTITLGAGQAIPGVEDLILETDVGSSTERPVRWPDDFPDETQRGATKMVRVTVHEAKRKDLPPLDDDFARSVGDFEGLAELKTALERDLKAHAARNADAAVRQSLIDAIIAANPFDVPRAWTGQMVRQYAETYQIPAEGVEQFAQEFWGTAERQVKRDLIVEAVAAKEGLHATESDIDDRIAEVAARRGTDPAQVYASVQKGGRMKEMEHGITEEKVFAWLLERSTVNDQQ